MSNVRTTKIATCYRPNSADNVPARVSLLIERDNRTKSFAVVEIADHVGTGHNHFFNSEAEALAYAESLGYTEVLRA